MKKFLIFILSLSLLPMINVKAEENNDINEKPSCENCVVMNINDDFAEGEVLTNDGLMHIRIQKMNLSRDGGISMGNDSFKVDADTEYFSWSYTVNVYTYEDMTPSATGSRVFSKINGISRDYFSLRNGASGSTDQSIVRANETTSQAAQGRIVTNIKSPVKIVETTTINIQNGWFWIS